MGRFINGDRPRCSPRLNIVKPARFDADHKELVNGVKKEETEARKEDKDDVDDRPKKKPKKSPKPQPIRRSSRKSVLMNANSPGVVTRSHLKQSGPKQHDVHNGTQPAHRNGRRKEENNETKTGEDKQERQLKIRRKSTVETQPVRTLRKRNISPASKKFEKMGAQKTHEKPARVHKSTQPLQKRVKRDSI